MRMPKQCIELIYSSYNVATPSELNELFLSKGLRTFKESTLQKKIEHLKELDRVKEVKRLKFEEKALANPIRYRATTLYNGAKSRAKIKNIPFNLTIDWIESKLRSGICECTGLSFYIKPYTRRESYVQIHPQSPSLDQIKPSKGYTMDNVQVVCDQFNKMKNDKTLKQTYFIAKHFVKFQKEKRNKKTELAYL